MTPRKFLIWTRGYAGESRIAVTHDGSLPKLTGLEAISHEILKPARSARSADQVSEAYARAMSSKDNS